MSARVLSAHEGGAGARVEILDETAPYGYANVFHVRLRVVACFAGVPETYERVLERLGVSEADLERVKVELIGGFEATALPYLFGPDFPARFAERCRRERAKVIPFPGVA